ncbi:hypothetical protein [Streptomyces sp. Ag109_G2-15]|uniref:hypothetical protein n=1 Tax=Streptomyces sp. Ag109_G2-15 TaxID=1938850 RepID=UPI00211BEBC3|nr:hypothetical protein [Streptomyces sp. Ag109_G2-15]
MTRYFICACALCGMRRVNALRLHCMKQLAETSAKLYERTCHFRVYASHVMPG